MATALRPQGLSLEVGARPATVPGLRGAPTSPSSGRAAAPRTHCNKFSPGGRADASTANCQLRCRPAPQAWDPQITGAAASASPHGKRTAQRQPTYSRRLPAAPSAQAETMDETTPARFDAEAAPARRSDEQMLWPAALPGGAFQLRRRRRLNLDFVAPRRATTLLASTALTR